jgi:hypothetical protein
MWVGTTYGAAEVSWVGAAGTSSRQGTWGTFYGGRIRSEAVERRRPRIPGDGVRPFAGSSARYTQSR